MVRLRKDLCDSDTRRSPASKAQTDIRSRFAVQLPPDRVARRSLTPSRSIDRSPRRSQCGPRCA